MHKFSLLVLMLLLMASSVAQDSANLVYNPSFEDYVACPRRIDALGILTIVEGWYQPTRGSADYYNRCGMRECAVPKNKLGVQEPHSGDAYCGIYCSKNDYREYLQTQLKSPLKKGRTYRLQFYVSLSELSPHIVATIGGLLSTQRLADTTFDILTNKHQKLLPGGAFQTISTMFQPQVVHSADTLLSDTEGWMLVQGSFVSQGGEEFLTIGNFYPESLSHFVDISQPENILPGAYYYIDDVSLECMDCQDSAYLDTLSDTPSEQAPDYSEGSVFILKNIFFEFDKSTLLQQSYNELQNLLTILRGHPKMKIEIGGHTDGRGSVDYNMRLSENRAQAVFQYLVTKGIDPKRLAHKGYGKSRPIDTNTTEEGRANNRRVEITILSNR